MNQAELEQLLYTLRAYSDETEWVEFKESNSDPEEIGQYISAMANSASLHKKDAGYIVWGIMNGTHDVVGTKFRPRQQRIGNEELESWLCRGLSPDIDFRIYEFIADSVPVVMFRIKPAHHTPIRFKDSEYIRVGSYKKKLRDFPEKERSLWMQLSVEPFEKGIAAAGVEREHVLELLDFKAYFQLQNLDIPRRSEAILRRFEQERLLFDTGAGLYEITNLGALLFAKQLRHFESLARKAARVISYAGVNRTQGLREIVGGRGYAAGFQGLVRYINEQLPRNEQIRDTLRQDVSVYPPIAIRELVANAIIHQDLNSTGDSPVVEIFTDRIEVTNFGRPLISTLRFMDEPPQSRNEALAAFMRRLKICEERGSGIDKVIFEVEFFQLPAPDFFVTENHTKAVLYAPRKLTEMSKTDKVRACYQHACLQHVSNGRMTNATLRKRFNIADKNYAIASRIIRDTLDLELVKPYDPESTSRKDAQYVPFWA